MTSLASGAPASPAPDPPASPPTPLSRLLSFAIAQQFLLLILLSILLAYLYPPLGSTYLHPEITSTYLAVIGIFLLSGLSLKTAALRHASSALPFNAAVQAFNMLLVPFLCLGVAKLLLLGGATSRELADGLLITACLPMTINMVIVLTAASGGDEAAAVFNAAAGNLLGVFATPALVLLFLGESNGIDFGRVVVKLSLRVLAPLCVGQALQLASGRAREFVKENKGGMKKAQELGLTYIVYCAFCITFDGDGDDPDAISASTADVLAMGFSLVVFHLLLLLLSWRLFALPPSFTPEQRVFALFGSTHKTLSMGVPLLTAMFEGDRRLGIYTLPLLIWHPAQLVIGSALAPRLKEWVEGERGRLDKEGDEADKKAELDGQYGTVPNQVL